MQPVPRYTHGPAHISSLASREKSRNSLINRVTYNVGAIELSSSLSISTLLVFHSYRFPSIITIPNHSIDKPLRILCNIFQGSAKASRLCNFIHFQTMYVESWLFPALMHLDSKTKRLTVHRIAGSTRHIRRTTNNLETDCAIRKRFDIYMGLGQ